jgi:hypothetical protein
MTPDERARLYKNAVASGALFGGLVGAILGAGLGFVASSVTVLGDQIKRSPAYQREFERRQASHT